MSGFEREFTSPIENQGSAKQHPAKVCEVGDACPQAGHAEKELEAAKDKDKIARLHGDGRKEEHHLTVGKEHAECEKDTESSAGGSNGRIGIATGAKGHGADGQLDEARAHHAKEVVGEEALRAPAQFDFPAEHPESQHIEENVSEVAVKETVGENLPWVEADIGPRVVAELACPVVDTKGPEREVSFQDAVSLEDDLEQKEHSVGNKQVQDHGRYGRVVGVKIQSGHRGR